MGRPSITGSTVVVEIDGDLLTWTDGLLSGTNQEYVEKAKELSKYSSLVNVTLFGPEIIADLYTVETPEAALAAMMGAVPGRGRILQAPQEVLNLLPFDDEEDDGFVYTATDDVEDDDTDDEE